MKTWTPDASAYFEAWLGRVRSSVAADPTIDAEEIAQDLRAHVHAELEAMPEPVTKTTLEPVLASLGNPTQWSDGVKPLQPATTVRFYTGAGDTVAEWQQKLAGEFGMPVLLAILTLIGIPTIDNVIGLPLLAFTYFVGRSHLLYAPQGLAGARKWMVYFPVAIGAGLLAGVVLAFPLTLYGPGGEEFQRMWSLGLWWILVGILAAREPRLVRSALKPFGDSFEASHGRTLSLIGASFVVAGTVLMFVN